MKTTRKVTREVEVHEYACDRCERPLRAESDSFGATRGLVASCSGGYGQEFPPDGETWEFALCEGCVAWLAGQMKRYPYAGNYMHQGEKPSEDTRRAVETGDFSAMWSNSDRALEAIRAFARRQSTPEAFAVVDALADAYQPLRYDALSRLQDLWNETVAVCHEVAGDEYNTDDPKQLVALAKQRMPNLAARLSSTTRTLAVIAESTDATADQLRAWARAELESK